MRILITNDDGMKAEGLRYLYNLLRITHDVTVVAPLKGMSGCSHSITLRSSLRVKRVADDIYGVTGTPTDCIVLGIKSIIKESPDMVISGINDGPNLGFDITYSGTVGGALEGAIANIPSVAISITGFSNFDDTSSVVFKLISLVKDDKFGKFLLNVNVPPEPKGIRITELGQRVYQDVITSKGNRYEIGGTPVHETADGKSDVEAIDEGYISITPLSLDLVDYKLVKGMQSVNEEFFN